MGGLRCSWLRARHSSPLRHLRRCAPPLPPVQAGSDCYVDGSAQCSWHLWGALPAASGGGREVEQSLLVRWLAGARCRAGSRACCWARLLPASQAGLWLTAGAARALNLPRRLCWHRL